MALRTGQEYIEGLRDPREVWIGSEPVADVTTHPNFKNSVRTFAGLYDLQHQPDLQPALSYQEPGSDDLFAITFMTPRSVDDLRRRREALYRISEACYGMLGRSPDLMGTVLMAWVNYADFFGEFDPRFGENLRNYYAYCRSNDLCLTHGIADPQIDRSKTASGFDDPFVYLGIVDEDSSGITVRGAKMLATSSPICDEIMAYPNRRFPSQEDARYSVGFGVPISTPGLKLICREPFDLDRPVADHPLGSRFEEVDAVVVFDDVHVPWERVFIKGKPELANQIRVRTNTFGFYQSELLVLRSLVKAEFVFGVACLLAEAGGTTEFLNVQERLGRLVEVIELQRACLKASLVDPIFYPNGTVGPDPEPLRVARNHFSRSYPEMIETVQVIGAGGLFMAPSTSVLDGPAGPQVRKYFQGAAMPAEQRILINKLAWDLVGDAFGQREVQYERYHNGDPFRNLAGRYVSYDRTSAVGRVKQLLAESVPRHAAIV